MAAGAVSERAAGPVDAPNAATSRHLLSLAASQSAVGAGAGAGAGAGLVEDGAGPAADLTTTSGSTSSPHRDLSIIVHPAFTHMCASPPEVFCPLDWLPDEVISNVLIHLVSERWQEKHPCDKSFMPKTRKMTPAVTPSGVSLFSCGCGRSLRRQDCHIPRGVTTAPNPRISCASPYPRLMLVHRATVRETNPDQLQIGTKCFNTSANQTRAS